MQRINKISYDSIVGFQSSQSAYMANNRKEDQVSEKNKRNIKLEFIGVGYLVKRVNTNSLNIKFQKLDFSAKSKFSEMIATQNSLEIATFISFFDFQDQVHIPYYQNYFESCVRMLCGNDLTKSWRWRIGADMFNIIE